MVILEKNVVKDILQRSRNDINVADIIFSFITDKCDICKSIEFIDKLNRVFYPYHYYSHNDCSCDEEIFKLICNACKDKNCCKNCNEFSCDKCQNKNFCKKCNNIFCNECKNESMIICDSCKDSFCCKKFIRYIDSNLDYKWECMDCVIFVYGKYYKP